VPSRHSRAFWISAPGQGSIVDESLREPTADEALVRTRYTAISRGTETLVYQGRVPESERSRMRAPFQQGEFPAPVKYGYCNVGDVEAGPPELVGRTVFTLFPHQDRFVVPAAALHRVPDTVPPQRAVLAANMETALNAVWDGGVKPGDRVAVVGAGAVGSLIAWLAGQIPGCDVVLVDINPARSAVAASLGVRFATASEPSGDRDVVFHASGAAAGLSTALALAAFEAVVIEASWFGSQSVPLPLGEAFHAQRLTIRSSQVGSIATVNRSRWDHRRRMELALRLLVAPALDALITGESPFVELPQVMRELASRSRDALCHRIRY
jgi:2-desacetyl-2-hydroxyethyl bacteriochlorophyllide A dehydrogenase